MIFDFNKEEKKRKWKEFKYFDKLDVKKYCDKGI